MTNIIYDFFILMFGSNSALATFFVAMIPVIEVKGAIPFGVNKKLWGLHALNIWQSVFFSLLGSVLVCMVLLLFFQAVYNKISAQKFMHPLTKRINKFSQKNQTFWMLFVLSALPLPLTGVFTSSALASLSGMTFAKKFIAIMTGNVACAVFVALATVFLGDNSINIFWIFLFSCFIICVTYLLKAIFSRET